MIKAVIFDLDGLLVDTEPICYQILKDILWEFGRPFTLEEYAENCRKLDNVEQAAILEVNISCPNVHAGGKNFGCDPRAAAEVTRAVRARR